VEAIKCNKAHLYGVSRDHGESVGSKIPKVGDEEPHDLSTRVQTGERPQCIGKEIERIHCAHANDDTRCLGTFCMMRTIRDSHM